MIMNMNIKMMGDFCLELDGNLITEKDNRSKKIWLLLAYFILNQNKKTSEKDIISFLWEDEGKVTNTTSAVKTTIHRLRSMLNGLSVGIGSNLIIYADKSYGWNPEVPISLDIDEFRRLCLSEDLSNRLLALSIYDELLPSFCNAAWLKERAAEHHSTYVTAVKSCCRTLFEQEQFEETAEICRRALTFEKLDEEIYRYLLQSLVSLGDYSEVVRTYESVSNLLIEKYGIVPSDELRTIYRQVLHTADMKYMPIDQIRESLREQEEASGAFLLEYDFFKTVYQTFARSVSRMEYGAHIAIFSVKEPEGKDLQERSIHVAVSNLQAQIMQNVRKGDSVTKCSSTQFIVLLPNCDYANGCMVSERIVSSFYRKHPHSPVEIIYSVQPVEQM